MTNWKKMIRCAILIAAAFVQTSCVRNARENKADARPLQKEGILLAENGRSLCNIVLPPQPTLIQLTAAEELSRYLCGMSGAETVSMSFAAVPGAGNLFLGTEENRDLCSRFRPETIGALKGDGYALKSSPEGVFIVGKGENGTLYGVYSLLKRIGMRWFHPAPDGEHCPKLSSIRIDFFETFSNPAFSVRWPGGDLNRSLTTEQADWHVRNGLQLQCPKWAYWGKNKFITSNMLRRPHLLSAGGGHVPSDLLCKRNEREKLFRDHPEYFGMVRGKRVLKYWAVNPCFSNPDVFRRIYEGVKKSLSDYPQGGIYTFGTDDTPQFCECGECLKDDTPYDRANHLTSTRFYKFVMKLKAELKRERVPGQLDAWGYHDYQMPPDKSLKFDRGVRIFHHAFGHCYAHAFDDPECIHNARLYKIYKAWRERGVSVLVNETTSCLPQGCDGGDMCRDPECRGVLFLPAERRIAETLRIYQKLGIAGCCQFMTPYHIRYSGRIFFKNRRNTDMPMSMWLFNYAFASFLWDPEMDFNAFLEDAGMKFYGAGWPEMKKFRLLMYELFEHGPHMFTGVTNEELARLLEARPGAEQEIDGYFEKAEKLVFDDPLRLRRVRLERDYYRESILKMFRRVRKEKRPPLLLRRTAAPFKVDGVFDESAWKNANSVTDFLADGKLEKKERQVSVKGLCDARSLRFAVEAMNPEAEKLESHETVPSLDIYKDAYLDIFLKAPDGKDFYYQITINPRGVCLEYKRNSGIIGTPFRIGTEVGTSIQNDRIRFEIAVPVSALGGSTAKGTVWRVNIGWMPKLSSASGKHGPPVSLGKAFHLSYMDMICE